MGESNCIRRNGSLSTDTTPVQRHHGMTTGPNVAASIIGDAGPS
jgi:hypothetical protein